MPKSNAFLEELVDAYAALPGIAGIALGGSRVAALHESASDWDIYVYTVQPIPVPTRATIVQARSSQFELGNRFWEEGDEWDERSSGVHIDVMYRDLATTRAHLDRLLVHHESAIGYSTSTWHNVRESRPLFDRTGELEKLLGYARQPYPRELAHSIIAKNRPLLRDSFGAFGSQLVKAAEREDRIAVNHRTSAFIGSYFDVLFAANLTTHPGEKRLVQHAMTLAAVPVQIEEDLDALLDATSPSDLSPAVDKLVDHLDEVITRLS
jgi:hypothetical protein